MSDAVKSPETSEMLAILRRLEGVVFSGQVSMEPLPRPCFHIPSPIDFARLCGCHFVAVPCPPVLNCTVENPGYVDRRQWVIQQLEFIKRYMPVAEISSLDGTIESLKKSMGDPMPGVAKSGQVTAGQNS